MNQATLRHKLSGIADHDEFVRACLCSDAFAIQFWTDLKGAIDLWDDILDKDREIPVDEVNQAFMGALIRMPSNPIFRNNADMLTPLVLGSIRSWQAANVLESTGEQGELAKSYTMRIAFVQVFIMLAEIVGGPGWADTVAPVVWSRFQTDTLDQYVSGHMPAGGQYGMG